MPIKVTKELVDTLAGIKSGEPYPYLNEKGQEVNDPKPLFIQADSKQLTMEQRIQRLLRSELSKQAMEQEAESFDEADDLEDDEDDDPKTKYELLDDEELVMDFEAIRREHKKRFGKVAPAKVRQTTDPGNQVAAEPVPKKSPEKAAN